MKELLENDQIPPILNESKCKKCAYYAYCYI
nr:Dna2/Cas4 domain-containing protein [Thomasclavelia cocleata]